MKLVHTTEYNNHNPNEYGWSASCLHIYEIENDDEWNEVFEAYDNPEKRDEILDDLGYHSEYGVPAGAQFSRYTLHIMGEFVVVEEDTAYNV